MTDQYLQNVNDRRILLQESLGECLTEYLILSDKLKNLIASGIEDYSDEMKSVTDTMEIVMGYITNIIETSCK
jgi:hypothetical protein